MEWIRARVSIRSHSPTRAGRGDRSNWRCFNLGWRCRRAAEDFQTIPTPQSQNQLSQSVCHHLRHWQLDSVRRILFRACVLYALSCRAFAYRLLCWFGLIFYNGRVCGFQVSNSTVARFGNPNLRLASGAVVAALTDSAPTRWSV